VQQPMTELRARSPQPGAAIDAMGLEVDELSGTRVVGHMQLGPDHHTPWGIVHGGVYAAAVESAASLGATAALADRGMVAVGLTNTTHFLRPLTAGLLTVRAVALNQGRTQQLWRVDITDAQDRLIAHGELRLQNIDIDTVKSPSKTGDSSER